MAKRSNNDEPKERKSKAAASDPKVDDSCWRNKVQRRLALKFDDDRKDRFLQKFLETGKKGLSADFADITIKTINEHLKNDEEFAIMYDETYQSYQESLVQQIETEARDGSIKETFDKETGQVTSRQKIYESNIRLAMLKANADKYKDRQDINLTGQGGGVLVVPAGVPMDEYLRQCDEQREKMLKDQAADTE